MEKVHAHVLANLDFDGQGTLLEVGCGSGALAIRAALTWPDARVIGIDSWAPVYFYSRAGCMKNADSEGVGMRCISDRATRASSICRMRVSMRS